MRLGSLAVGSYFRWGLGDEKHWPQICKIIRKQGAKVFVITADFKGTNVFLGASQNVQPVSALEGMLEVGE